MQSQSQSTAHRSQAQGTTLNPPASSPRDSPSVIRSMSGINRLRSEESWVEVSSQPSSSSLSSIGNDEVVTTGLRIIHDNNPDRRRRRLHNNPRHISIPIRPLSAAGSSQEEYEESESENDSDRMMSSSNEDHRFQQQDESSQEQSPPDETIPPAACQSLQQPLSDVPTSDDDENVTALGARRSKNSDNNAEQCFTPQPNAFTHPPNARQTAVPGSYFPATSLPTTGPAHQQRTHSYRNSYPSDNRSRTHTPYNMISPSHSLPVDHDAALRASLSTLLSCAAAARGLPKRDDRLSSIQPANIRAGNTASRATGVTAAGPSNRVEPTSLRLVPESALNSVPSQSATAAATTSRSQNKVNSTTTPSQPRQSSSTPPKSKRTSTSPSRPSSTSTRPNTNTNANNQQHTSKKRRTSPSPSTATNSSSIDEFVSPTLMTWVVSASVVVLFGVVGFGAGYVVGREVGRIESAMDGVAGQWGGVGVLGANGGAVACGRELGDGAGLGVGRGLKRLRWGNGSGVIRV